MSDKMRKSKVGIILIHPRKVIFGASRAELMRACAHARDVIPFDSYLEITSGNSMLFHVETFVDVGVGIHFYVNRRPV